MSQWKWQEFFLCYLMCCFFCYFCCCLFKLNARNPIVQYEFDYFHLLSLEILAKAPRQKNGCKVNDLKKSCLITCWLSKCWFSRVTTIEPFPPSLPLGAHSVGGKWAGACKCRPTGLPKWLCFPAAGRAGSSSKLNLRELCFKQL